MVQNGFIAPKNSFLLEELAKLLFPFLMHVKHGTFSLRIVGDGLKRLKRLRKKRVVICPNHSSEDDAEVAFGLARLTGESFYYLTAHEIFHGNHGWNSLILPRLGCYSITRGIQDISAYRMTKKLLVEKKRKLVVFPEGEVSHFNEIVMPLERGVVQMAFAAIDELDRRKIRDTIFVLPVAIKYVFSANVQEQLAHSMKIIESELGMSTTNMEPLYSRARLALMQFVSNFEKRYNMSTSEPATFAERMNTLRAAILEDIARRLCVELPDSGSQVETAHTLKTTLCDLFYHHCSGNGTKYDAGLLKSLFKDVLAAIHLIAVEDSLVGNPSANPTQEETAEVIELLEAALHLRRSIHSSKIILIDIGTPIDLRDFQKDYKVNKSAVVHDINHMIRLELLSMIANLSQTGATSLRGARSVRNSRSVKKARTNSTRV